jgi:hypothetical protein
MRTTDKGGEFENPEPGPHAARLIRAIDMGNQKNEMYGNERHELMLVWELAAKMSDGRPFIMSNFYSLSHNEKSTLRQHFQSWRGKTFTKEELDESGIPIEKALGKTCMITIDWNSSGKRLRVSAVTRLPDGMTMPPQVNSTVFLSLAPKLFDRKAFDGLSDKMKAKIKMSPEYQALEGGATASPSDEFPPDDGADIPF